MALKRLHSKLSANAGGPGQDGVLTEATREVQLLSALRHPNIIGMRVGASPLPASTMGTKPSKQGKRRRSKGTEPRPL